MPYSNTRGGMTTIMHTVHTVERGVRKCTRPQSMIVLMMLACGMFVLHWIFDTSMSLYPEADMVLNSNCFKPFGQWNGRIWLGMDVQVWFDGASKLPWNHNLNNESSLETTLPEVPHFSNRIQNDRPLIIWGTHHKTGTYVAIKLFAKICSEMNWCCRFHRTRDSIHSIDDMLSKESVDVLGHNQWIWSPKADNITSYKFIHFYRNPVKKIISGYKYHSENNELWVTKPLFYNESCAASFVNGVRPEAPVMQNPKGMSRRARMARLAKIDAEKRDRMKKSQHKRRLDTENPKNVGRSRQKARVERSSEDGVGGRVSGTAAGATGDQRSFRNRANQRLKRRDQRKDASAIPATAAGYVQSNESSAVAVPLQQNLPVEGMSSKRNTVQPSVLQVMEYCRSIHLCETCCRKAHESSETVHSTHSAVDYPALQFWYRPSIEYNFMCKHLGTALHGGSLLDGLIAMTPEEGESTQHSHSAPSTIYIYIYLFIRTQHSLYLLI